MKLGVFNLWTELRAFPIEATALTSLPATQGPSAALTGVPGNQDSSRLDNSRLDNSRLASGHLAGGQLAGGARALAAGNAKPRPAKPKKRVIIVDEITTS